MSDLPPARPAWYVHPDDFDADPDAYLELENEFGVTIVLTRDVIQLDGWMPRD